MSYLKHLFFIGALVLPAFGCMQIRPAATIDQVVTVLAEGDLPSVTSKAANALIMSSKVPVVIMLTAEWCKACKSVKGDFWRASRKNQDAFIGVQIDIDQNRDFLELHDKTELPKIVVYEKGGERWSLVGIDGVRRVLSVLKDNQNGFITGLSAAAAPKDLARAKVFLIAASADSANFGQEIADQYEYWKRSGLREEEIACYWSVPNFGQYWTDNVQFKALGKKLSKCQKADLSTITSHWETAAKERKNKKDWMYMYVTSHGTSTKLSNLYFKELKSKIGKDKIAGIVESCEQFGKAHILFDSVSNRREALDISPLYLLADKACQNEPAGVNMLTQKTLDSMIRKTGSTTKVTAILQACHSGAIIPDKLPGNTSVLAAASADRSSFGCDVQGERTVYGKAILDALDTLKPNPGDGQAWLAVHEFVTKRIQIEEEKLGVSKADQSNPVIRQN